MEENNKIQPKQNNSLKLPKLHQNIAKASSKSFDEVQGEKAFQANIVTNRIALLLDCSSSMSSKANGSPKIEHLRSACLGFLKSCNLEDTSVGISLFPQRERGIVALSQDYPILTLFILGLEANGGTPMAQSMKDTLDNIPLTRGVLVSDGQPTDNHPIFGEEGTEGAVFFEAKRFAKADIPIDCVHIGEDSSGEETLKKIAELTGGIYIKFKDVSSFAKSFKYLTPALRYELTSGSLELLGAEEIKR